MNLTLNLTLAIALEPGTSRAGHFGLASRFRVYRFDGPVSRSLGDRDTAAFCGAPGPRTLDRTLERLADCQAVAASAIGPCGRSALAAHGMQAVLVAGEAGAAARQAYRALTGADAGAGGAA